MKNIVLIAVLMVLTNYVWSISPKDDKRKNEESEVIIAPEVHEGIVYALPRTGFQIEIEVERINFFPGPYAPFAKKYLGIDSVGLTSEEKYLISEITTCYVSEADPSAVFLCPITDATGISMLPGGVISGINIQPQKPIETISGSDYINTVHFPDAVYTDRSVDDNYFIEIDSENGEETIMEKPDEEKAREAADYLFRIKRKRGYTILSPSDAVPEDGLGYKVFVEQSEKVEKEYVSLFIGKTFHNKENHSFIFYPDSTNIDGEVLCRFSESKGVLPATDITAKPIMIKLSSEAITAATLDSMKICLNPEAGSTGIYYRIPVMADMEISWGFNTLYNGKAPVGQLGTISKIPANILNGNH
ncbi:MAG: DUF4831 family protein, partial [Prolixibacteraceae bacterium]|nr:DUF4831 family protein [Prolixibacteraceae bacterium]